MPEPRFIRVEDKASGHQYYLPPDAIDPEGHKKVNASVRWPDITDPEARPAPPLYRTDKAGSPAPQAGSPADNKES